MKREPSLFIKDVLESMEKINEFVGSMSFNEFVQDDKTVSAVIRKLEIIGEATKNIPEEIRRTHEQIPWREMARMRDRLAHGYFIVDFELVWKVIKEELPPIKSLIEKMLEGR